jgi:hypothetical protein
MYAGAYHIAGYAVEFGLKACIAKTVAEFEFPDREIFQSAWTHKIKELVGVAGLTAVLKADCTGNAVLESNWALAMQWKPEVRYRPFVSERDATGLYRAIAARNHGVLQWIRRHW